MHFYSTTFDDKERTREINRILGDRFSFLESLKMGGTGSSRMLVEEVSNDLEAVMNRLSNVNYSSIELRPKGIIVHFVQQGLKSWSWLIPYSNLKINTDSGLKITDGKTFVSFRNDNHLRSNQKFIQKLIGRKNIV